MMNFIGGIWNMLEARRRRRNMETAVIFGIGCGGFLICGIVAVIVGSILNAVETGAVRSTYGETYASACNPMPSGRDSLDNMNEGDTPRQFLLLTGDTQRRDDYHSELPEQWRAENEEEVSFVGCVERDEEVLETCSYNRQSDEGSYTVTVDREQESATIVIVNPDTGRRIDSLEVIGDEPDECPDDYEDVPAGNIIRGDDPDWDEFAEWIEEYVFED